MPTLHPYLTFDGNCEEAFDHYQSIFGGEFPYKGRFSEMPPMEGCPPPSEAEANKIMHISLPIGEGSVLMGSDSMEPHVPGNNVTVSVSTDSNEETDRIYAGLADGGEAKMPPADMFWGSYFGMCVDRFGIQWMVSNELEGQSHE